MVNKEKANLRWGVERRLEFIEFRLFWEGRVNRSDLIDTFGISINQASIDLNRYLRMAPANMAYDKRVRSYIRTEKFNPKFLKLDADHYLTQLRSVADGIIEPSQTWMGTLPAFDTAPIPVRGINAIALRTVVSAIWNKDAIEVKYQSLSRPEPRWRWITPHAIAFDGFRWHTRAYCEIDRMFKDFLLSRILDTRRMKPGDINPDQDSKWQEQITLEIGPHPDLSETQRKVIELDYGMSEGKAAIRTRKALLYYTLKRLGLDTNPSARKPQDQQIVLLETTTDSLIRENA